MFHFHKKTRLLFFFILFPSFFFASLLPLQAANDLPFNTRLENNNVEYAYEKHNIHGWKVMISNDVQKNKTLYQRILKQVDQDLKNIIEVIPKWSLPYLRETPIWFEKKMPPPFNNNLFFNGSKKGSKIHKIEHLYGGVVAGSTQSYLAVANIHPWQLLHELTHAYHQFVTKHSYQPIRNAYQNAIENNLHRFGNQYARKNHKEYFSTLTEAYFGLDANFPHNRQELATHDPIGYCAIVKAWGLAGQQAPNAPLKCTQ